MNCRNAESYFSAFIEDELSQEEQRSLESHLLGCRRCAASLKELRASLELVAALPRVDTSVHFEEDVMDRIRSGEALRPSLIEWLGETLSPARLRPVFLAGATICAVWISVLLIHPGGHDLSPQVATTTPNGSSPVEAPPSTNHEPEVTSPDAGGGATHPTAPALANAAPEAARTPAVASLPVAATSRAGGAGRAAETTPLTPGDYAWADHDMPMNSSAVDSTLPNSGTRYQDEYILDQFYLNRSDQDGVHSIVPVSGQKSDDVYITF